MGMGESLAGLSLVSWGEGVIVAGITLLRLVVWVIELPFRLCLEVGRCPLDPSWVPENSIYLYFAKPARRSIFLLLIRPRPAP